MDSVRIDKYLWAIRTFKTRSDAAQACNGNKVKLNGVNAKASKAVKRGDIIEIRKGPALLSFKVIELSEHRVSASLVPTLAENITPEAELQKFFAPRETIVLQRDRGTGRPTKKERRQIDSLQGAMEDFAIFED